MTDLDCIIYSFANIYRANKQIIQDKFMSKYDQNTASYKLYETIRNSLGTNEYTYVSGLIQGENSPHNYYQGGDIWAYNQMTFNGKDSVRECKIGECVNW